MHYPYKNMSCITILGCTNVSVIMNVSWATPYSTVKPSTTPSTIVTSSMPYPEMSSTSESSTNDHLEKEFSSEDSDTSKGRFGLELDEWFLINKSH